MSSSKYRQTNVQAYNLISSSLKVEYDNRNTTYLEYYLSHELLAAKCYIVRVVVFNF